MKLAIGVWRRDYCWLLRRWSGIDGPATAEQSASAVAAAPAPAPGRYRAWNGHAADWISRTAVRARRVRQADVAAHRRQQLGVETAVVEGDPSKPGYYLTINHFPKGVMSRPHYHPDER